MAKILDAFASKLLDGLAFLGKNEVALGLTDEIARLKETLEAISAFLADAERKKIRDKAIDNWLKKLKDVMYDADDILDEYWIEAQKSRARVSSGRQPSSYSSFRTSERGHFRLFSCSCFGHIAFAHQIGREIRGLNHRLDDILAEKSNFDLQLSSADRDYHRSTSRISRMTSSVPESDIVGSNIEKDTEKLVELLIKEDTRENIPVYAIVGIGGIGKTTLARLIYNNESIAADFPTKLWVCVSRDFIESSLLKDIITQAGGDPGGASSRAQLEPMVRNTVKKKKFLLVLDDLWDAKVWNNLLQDLLQSGATGSRVLVTTRNGEVASKMKAVEPHHQVKVMSAEDGWKLLCKKVGLSEEGREIKDLKDTGKEIVDKCGRLPLAIKTIGGVLATKSRTKKDWEQVLKILSNDSWSSLPEGVQPALYLSYEDLPSHLKQCFLYCSLFPKDYKFNRCELIHFWISEGFIDEEGDLTLEEIGEDYYEDLIQRSLLQPHPSFPGCTVHDRLWSLAQFAAQDEMLVMKNGVEVVNSSSSVKPRRFRGHVIEEKRQEFIDALEGHNSLWTLLLSLDGSKVKKDVINNLIKKTPRLRVLGFSWSKIIKLPESLGNLIHLHYLDVSWSEISELPDSIGNLVNLQFLILQFCEFLRSLPKSIGKLHNLRCLDLFGTELEGIPVEIANLHLLNKLKGFVVRNNNSKSGWCTLEELRSLKKLKVLHIKHLARASNEGEVREVNALQDMLQLKELWLSCSPSGHHDDEETQRIEKIFELMLCPQSQLEFLIIKDFFGLHYPSWITSSSTHPLLSGLRRLHLAGCRMCPQLPPLGKLPNLEYLYIAHASAVIKIQTEFLGQENSRDQGGKTQISFPNLTKLIFKEMSNWEEWEWEVKDDDRLIALPNLKELELHYCPKLRSLPSGLVHHANTLTKLQIRYCGSLEAIRGFSSIKEMEISGCDSLKEIRGFSSIKKLEISYSPNLEDVLDLPSLKTLLLRNPKMRCLPEWFHGGQSDFHELNKLEITASNKLLRRCLEDGLDWPKIEHIPYVYARNCNGSRYVSKSRDKPPRHNLYVDADDE